MEMVRFGFEDDMDGIFCGQIKEELYVSLDIFLIWKAISLLMRLIFLSGLWIFVLVIGDTDCLQIEKSLAGSPHLSFDGDGLRIKGRVE